ncbi:CHCH-like protein [Artemisia annua]|uniref:CHCH-like protein n=1 Tax=Artemisia annua TaxID=35608 RepID=A0A2U1MYU8_ARTAN|nr:CHCH-like protein [Artemisia annua]
MVQDQSKTTDAVVVNTHESPQSMESLLAEATMYGHDDENASLEDKAKKALDCPCIQDLRSGPCGSQFSEAFLCFLKSTHEEKGFDCVQRFNLSWRCRDVLKPIPMHSRKKYLKTVEKRTRRNQNQHKRTNSILATWLATPNRLSIRHFRDYISVTKVVNANSVIGYARVSIKRTTHE